MRFDPQAHQRGMHSLAEQPDHQILARARLKGMLIHPSSLEATLDPSSSIAIKQAFYTAESSAHVR